MKLLYLTDQIYLHGGIEKVLSQKANYFAEASGDEVTIVTYNQQERIPVYQFSKKIQMIDLGINYEIGKSYFHPVNLKKVFQHKKALAKVLKEIQPEVVISSSFGPDFYFVPFVERQIPKIKEFHASRYFDQQNAASLKSSLLKLLGTKAEQNYHQLVVLNRDEMKYYGGDKITVIPNPADVGKHSSVPGQKKILAAGRISPVKNFGELIDLFAEVSCDFPEWELHFWGEDYLGTREKLQQKINRHQLQHRIKFMGITEDLKEEMTHYSIYAMTSETECFPMVLLESLSAGLPVVSYDSPTGPRHIVKDGEDGFIVPYKNLDIFTEKLRLLMRDENLRSEMGAKGPMNAHRFSIDTVMTQWKDLFKKLISQS